MRPCEPTHRYNNLTNPISPIEPNKIKLYQNHYCYTDGEREGKLNIRESRAEGLTV